MGQQALNAYKIMWLFVCFDLPTTTQKERKRAALFRKVLLKDGFGMMQYSLYVRHCASAESLKVHEKRIEAEIPQEGHVSLLQITDKQYSNIKNYWGEKSVPLKRPAVQLEFF